MTPAEHYQAAVQLLGTVQPSNYPELVADDLPAITAALAHGVLAIAAELGVPTDPATARMHADLREVIGSAAAAAVQPQTPAEQLAQAAGPGPEPGT